MGKKMIVIVGATAVGKTAAAVALAQHFNTEIISADSRQCYKELNIGVAKPSLQELEIVPHYFINSHSICDDVNAIVFEKYALCISEKIFEKHDVAVMVGGTGLYIKSFCEGMDAVPQIAPEVRSSLTQLYNANGLEWLQEVVRSRDTKFWNIAEQQNPQRLLRALEVLTQTGKSITTFWAKSKTKRNFEIIKIGLQLPKEILYRAIDIRINAMVAMGLEEEVKKIQPYQHLNALQTVGYKELFAYLNCDCNFNTAIAKIKINTRKYAKRQTTWFKKDTTIQWLPANEEGLLERILACL